MGAKRELMSYVREYDPANSETVALALGFATSSGSAATLLRLHRHGHLSRSQSETGAYCYSLSQEGSPVARLVVLATGYRRRMWNTLLIFRSAIVHEQGAQESPRLDLGFREHLDPEPGNSIEDRATLHTTADYSSTLSVSTEVESDQYYVRDNSMPKALTDPYEQTSPPKGRPDRIQFLTS